MSDWMDQYSAALDVRDAREQAHKHYIDAYTRLADRTAAAAVSSNLASTTPGTTAAAAAAAVSSTTAAPPFFSSKPSTPLPPPSLPTDILSTLRTDLSTTQRARSALQSQLTTLTTQLATLQTTHTTSLSQIGVLQREKAVVERKLRDREDELHAKGKLATDAQDEMVALQLQLNMAEQRTEGLERENRELVERWMKRKGEEADMMNRDSRWE